MTVLDSFRLDGRVALVAGAGRGIGSASALALAAAGADVVLLSRTATQIEAVATDAQKFGVRALAIATDTSDGDAVSAAIELAVGELGRLDVVVSVVGGSMPKPFLETSDRSLLVGFERNVVDGLRLVRLATPHLLASEAASVVMISSAIGHVTGRGYVGYGTVKAALDHAVRMLAVELNPTIRVNAVAPGAVLTEALEMVLSDPTIADTLKTNTPLRRIGVPDDIAAAVLYLASSASSYVTGQILAVDGGLSITNMEMPFPDLMP